MHTKVAGALSCPRRVLGGRLSDQRPVKCQEMPDGAAAVFKVQLDNKPLHESVDRSTTDNRMQQNYLLLSEHSELHYLTNAARVNFFFFFLNGSIWEQ